MQGYRQLRRPIFGIQFRRPGGSPSSEAASSEEAILVRHRKQNHLSRSRWAASIHAGLSARFGKQPAPDPLWNSVLLRAGQDCGRTVGARWEDVGRTLGGRWEDVRKRAAWPRWALTATLLTMRSRERSIWRGYFPNLDGVQPVRSRIKAAHGARWRALGLSRGTPAAQGNRRHGRSWQWLRGSGED